MVNETHFAKSDHMETFFRNKETDCVIFSEEGINFNIHKEILSQTEFMRNILLSTKDCCYTVMQIFCPYPKFLKRMFKIDQIMLILGQGPV